jgi:hypothetical protein
MTEEEDAFQEFSARARGFLRCGIHTSMAAVRGKGVDIMVVAGGINLHM